MLKQPKNLKYDKIIEYSDDINHVKKPVIRYGVTILIGLALSLVIL